MAERINPIVHCADCEYCVMKYPKNTFRFACAKNVYGDHPISTVHGGHTCESYLDRNGGHKMNYDELYMHLKAIRDKADFIVHDMERDSVKVPWYGDVNWTEPELQEYIGEIVGHIEDIADESSRAEEY